MCSLKGDAFKIIDATLKAVNPERAVIAALSERRFNGNVYIAAIGKAAYTMACAAKAALDKRIIKAGVVVTKYGHAESDIDGFRIIEAGHPVPDENSIAGAKATLDMTADLKPEDTVLFLVSGGGSALFELPESGVSLADIENVTRNLLNSGADIVEMNTLRKRLSKVKAGKFAVHCAPASIFTLALSDVIGDRLDSIASGPAFPDNSTMFGVVNISLPKQTQGNNSNKSVNNKYAA